MKEQFDKKLADKIKDSFANHLEPYDPVQWEKLSKAYFHPKTVSKPIWVWLISGIAASLVIGLLILPQFRSTESEIKNELALVDTVEKQQQDEYSTKIDELSAQEKFSQNAKLSSDNNAKNSENPNVKITVDEDSPSAVSQIDSNEVNQTYRQSFNKNQLFNEIKPVIAFTVPSKIEIPEKLNLRSEGLMISPLDQKTAFKPQQEKMETLKPNFDHKSSLLAEDTEKAQELIKQWLSEAKIEEDEPAIKRADDKPMRLGLILAPQTISNNTQALNLGAGVLSEFSFSKRLKLDVGVAYARQTITPSVNNEVMSLSSVQYSSNDVRSASFASNFVNASYELSFGQLEIPLNLKYKLIDNKGSDFYLITGVSNMVYLNQKNVGTFTAANFTTSGLMQVQQSVQTFTETATPNSENNGGDVNVGQMLNFSLGYEYNLKNGTFVSVEPFYKMSVGGQTFINQQFGIGGLNLRMNFQLKKQ